MHLEDKMRLASLCHTPPGPGVLLLFLFGPKSHSLGRVVRAAREGSKLLSVILRVSQQAWRTVDVVGAVVEQGGKRWV